MLQRSFLTITVQIYYPLRAACCLDDLERILHYRGAGTAHVQRNTTCMLAPGKSLQLCEHTAGRSMLGGRAVGSQTEGLIAWQCMQREQAERAHAAAEVLAAQHEAAMLRANLQQHAANPGSLHAPPSLQVGSWCGLPRGLCSWSCIRFSIPLASSDSWSNGQAQKVGHGLPKYHQSAS